MTTISATPNTATASITLVIEKTAAVTKVLRNNINGVGEVRALQTQLPSSASGQLILEDYEASAGLNTYTVIDGAEGAGTSVTLELDGPWLLVPVMPNYSQRVLAITNYGSQRIAQSTVHKVIGRESPLVSFGPLGLREGELEIFCASLIDARKIESVFTRGQPVMLKQNVEGMDMYMHGLSISITPVEPKGEDSTRYALSVDYLEVSRPSGTLSGALGWTLDELALSYSSFDEVAMKFASFDDLTIRREI